MKPGKLPENVLKRSVLKFVKSKREEVKVGAAVGADCAILKFDAGEDMATAVCSRVAEDEESVWMALASVTNNLAAAGSEPVAVLVTLLLPKGYQESDMKDLMLFLEKKCREYKIEIAGGHTQVLREINAPVINLTAIGKRPEEWGSTAARPGQDIVVAGYIGAEGTLRLVKNYKKDLGKRFSESFLEDAMVLREHLSVMKEAAIAGKSGVRAMHDVSGGGIFGALWELAQRSGVGLEIDLRKIPVKQHTIEVCNFFQINPYELQSGGCLLMAAEDGEQVAEALQQEGIPAVVVGKATAGNDRLITVDEEMRFLTPPKKDAAEVAREIRNQ